jgi:hypothetical protein
LIINPFQSVEFAASYEVLNVNKLVIQYYGKSSINQYKNKGTIDINLNIKCYGDQALTKIINEPLTITVNTVNTGYTPLVLFG